MTWPFRRQPRDPLRSEWSRAQKLLHKRDFAGAVEVLTRICEKAPSHFEARVNLGAALYNLGRFTAAIEQLQQAHDLDPEHATPLLNLAAAYNALGRVGKAAEVLEDLAQRHPEHRDVHYNLAIAYGKQGRLPEALEAVRRELTLAPTHPLALQMAAQLERQLARAVSQQDTAETPRAAADTPASAEEPDA
jgi:Flp pilus assembly protein TadD